MNYFHIHVMYGGEDFDFIGNFFRELSWDGLTTVFVQNLHNGRFPKISNSICIHGSNSLREFGGWQEGVDYLLLRNLLKDDDVLVLTNDTIFRERRLLPVVGKAFSIARVSSFSEASVLGPVVYELFGASIFGVHLKKLLATYFWAMRWGHLKGAGGIVGDFSFDDYLSSSYSHGPLFKNLKNIIYNNFYNRWLGASRADGVGDWWASYKIPFSQKNYNFLREKAVMILLESNLSARLISRKYIFSDIYQTSLKSIAKKRIKRIWQIFISIFDQKNS